MGTVKAGKVRFKIDNVVVSKGAAYLVLKTKAGSSFRSNVRGGGFFAEWCRFLHKLILRRRVQTCSHVFFPFSDHQAPICLGSFWSKAIRDVHRERGRFFLYPYFRLRIWAEKDPFAKRIEWIDRIKKKHLLIIHEVVFLRRRWSIAIELRFLLGFLPPSRDRVLGTPLTAIEDLTLVHFYCKGARPVTHAPFAEPFEVSNSVLWGSQRGCQVLPLIDGNVAKPLNETFYKEQTTGTHKFHLSVSTLPRSPFHQLEFAPKDGCNNF